MSAVDHAFVKAISTIKAMSRGQNGLGRPPPEARINLYGLYKQATEGDVHGILARPAGTSPQDEASKLKWDAWRANHGVSRSDAKLQYIEYLLETMRGVSTGTPDAQALLDDLERIYEAAKSGVALPGGNHQRAWSLASNNSTYSQFLRRPTYSEFGLSVGDRTDRLSERGGDFDQPENIPGPAPAIPLPQIAYSGGGPASAPLYAHPEETLAANANWKQDVAWQLETINEEINRWKYDTHQPPNSRELRTVAQAGGGGSGSSAANRGHNGSSGADSGAAAAGAGSPSSEFWAACLRRIDETARSFGNKFIEHLKRLAVDVSGLIIFLIIVRMVRSQPALLDRMPITRRFFLILGNLIAVALREVGFDIRPLPPAGASQAPRA